MVLSLSIGIIGTLMLGFGMSCATVLTEFFVVGIIIGVLGMIVLGMAYPVYKKVTKKQREKIAEEIIRLSEELMQ